MNIPWSEKYRPTTSEAIVLDEENTHDIAGDSFFDPVCLTCSCMVRLELEKQQVL